MRATHWKCGHCGAWVPTMFRAHDHVPQYTMPKYNHDGTLPIEVKAIIHRYERKHSDPTMNGYEMVDWAQWERDKGLS